MANIGQHDMTTTARLASATPSGDGQSAASDDRCGGAA